MLAPNRPPRIFPDPVTHFMTDTVVSGACRFCGTPLSHTFVDLGMSPLCESYIPADRLGEKEPFYPLRVFVCDRCFLVQLPAHVGGEEIFTEYAYFSSYSESWLAHAERYAEAMIARLGLKETSQVVEVASNDGYLLQYFVRRGIPSLGIEPAANVAAVATAKGIPTLVEFFGRESAAHLVARGIQADLLAGNNVLAQVPDLNDFVAGLALVLRPGGVLTLEFPHLMRLVEENQFDTIYHEHYSYFSLGTVEAILRAHGLTVFDVETLPTHGGSLRILARHATDPTHPVTERVCALRRLEESAGLNSLEYYASFDARVRETRGRLVEFLEEARREGKRVAGYGAPGKGNTLLNYCGIGVGLLEYTVDRNPYKQGKFLPGSRIPVFAPEKIDETRPDYLLILPWNIEEEIVAQMSRIRDWGGQFAVPIPSLRIRA
jgi:SAM-dependent methyltransferase